MKVGIGVAGTNTGAVLRNGTVLLAEAGAGEILAGSQEAVARSAERFCRMLDVSWPRA